MADRAPARRGAAHALMVASGFAGLGYQIVWTRQGALWLGHETPAVLAVVSAFFAGLALGAGVIGRRIEAGTRPARAYAACEGVIGAWGVLLAFAMAPVSSMLLGVIGPEPSTAWHWSVAFCGTFALLLPATAAMGATLPALARLVERERGAAVAGLYAANTAGALAGVLLVAFVFVPELGLLRSAIVCAGVNALCALAAWRMDGPVPAAPPAGGNAAFAWRLAATGLLGIGYEVLVVRVLSQVAEDTVYTFAMLLAVYLVGSALGAAAWQRRAGRVGDGDGDRLMVATGAACALGTATLWWAQDVKDAWLALVGPGYGSALSAEAVLALIAFGVPTVAMGALFGQLAAQAQRRGTGLAAALAANALGAALAPMLFGVLLLPALGAKAALLACCGGYLALCARTAWRRPPAVAFAAALAGAALFAPRLAFVAVPEGGRLVEYREGASASVSVVEDAEGVAVLRIDNRAQEGSSATLAADARQALLPLLLHPAPRRALFLGLGTGLTSGAAAQDATLAVTAVELLPEVVAASAHFAPALGDGARRPTVLVADARRFVRTTGERFDVIVSDNFHPARSGAGSLYTVEHFAAVRERLADDGLFCQWLPLHQLDLDTLRSIVRSFLTVYPDARALLATNSLETPVIGLLGQRAARPFEPLRLRARIAAVPATYGIDDEWALLGSFVAGPAALARFAGDTPANTDDRPVVAYRAPRATYAPESRPRDRLIELVAALGAEPAGVIEADADAQRRLAAYWRARDRFLIAGRDVRPTSDVRAMLAQVREPLLDVLRESPDFRPAALPLERMAASLSYSDPAAANALSAQLAAAMARR